MLPSLLVVMFHYSINYEKFGTKTKLTNRGLTFLEAYFLVMGPENLNVVLIRSKRFQGTFDLYGAPSVLGCSADP